MKVGLIRCMKTEDICPASTCFKVINTKKKAFKDISDDIEIIGVSTCGGCPGKKAAKRAVKMVKHGADTIALASCITKEGYKGHLCPYAQQIKSDIKDKIDSSIKIIDYTH